ncbi:hypothetical protein TNCV_4795871 [Trichonephila clavipes]|nr:hypothetical protein TNCV_4795871 [Trichonephila clavipes]
MCSSNPARHEREPSVDHLETGDEKWIVYKHGVRTKSYKGEIPPSRFKVNEHQKKVTLCCCLGHPSLPPTDLGRVDEKQASSGERSLQTQDHNGKKNRTKITEFVKPPPNHSDCSS